MKKNKFKQKRKKISLTKVLINIALLMIFIILIFINKNKIEYMFNKNKNLKVQQAYSSNSLNIGDIVYYNHKTAENSDNTTKQIVEISKGNSKQPGYGIGTNEETTFKTTYIWDKYSVKDETYTEKEKYTDYKTETYTEYERQAYTEYETESYTEYEEQLVEKTRRAVTGGGYYDTYVQATQAAARDAVSRKNGKIEVVRCEGEYCAYTISYDETYYEYETVPVTKYRTIPVTKYRTVPVQKTRQVPVTKYRDVTKTRQVKGNYVDKAESSYRDTYPSDGIEYGYWYQYSGEKKETIQNNNTINNTQKFNANDYNITWKVWDKKPNGEIVLIANNTIGPFETGGPVGHIWWEHNSHKIASIFGYGYGAKTNETENFEYIVGSGIDNAPDMIYPNDKGIWKIGVNGINISAARSLSLKDVQDKLGITDQKISDGTEGIKNNRNQNNGGPFYGNTINLSTKYVVQRDVDSLNQKWKDKKIGIALNNNYNAKDRNYWWDKGNIPNGIHKNLIFSNIDATTSLASNGLNVYDSGKYINFRRDVINNNNFSLDANFFISDTTENYIQRKENIKIRPIVTLKSSNNYYKVQGKDNEWDLSSVNKEKKIYIENYQKLDFEPKISIIQNTTKYNTTKEGNKNVVTIKYKDGIERTGSGVEAVFNKVYSNTKYKIQIENLPNGYTFKVDGKDTSEIDVKEKNVFTIVIYKNNTVMPERETNGFDLNIGDIIYYNHKKADNNLNKDKIKTTINIGSAKDPGSGTNEEQYYDASTISTVWRVWDINQNTGEVTIISQNVPGYTRTGAIGYIWQEQTMHKVASTYGYGYGANVDTQYKSSLSKDQNFMYKVGSGVSALGDTEYWKLGEKGINKSASRAITLKDIEEKLGITDETIKNGSTSTRSDYGVGYGNTARPNVYFAQREVPGKSQTWANKSLAKSSKRTIDVVNEGYGWNWDAMPESTYKNLLRHTGWTDRYGLATNSINSDSNNVIFRRAGSYIDSLYSGISNLLVSRSNDAWEERTSNSEQRILTFLKPDITYYKAPNENNAWDIVKLETTQKKLGVKIINYSNLDEKVFLKFESDLPMLQGRKDPTPIEIKAYKGHEIQKEENVDMYSGTMREGKLIEAKFVDVTNKYKASINEISSNNNYKIIGVNEDGIIDLSNTDNIEIVIYPKPGTFTIPVEYIGGSKDSSFSLDGTIIIKDNLTKNIISSKKVNLKRGINELNIENIDLFDNDTNKMKETEITFEKDKTQNNLHTAKYNGTKLIVDYVPNEKEITVTATFENGTKIKPNEITLDLISNKGNKIEVKLLKKENYKKIVKVPEKNKDGENLTYKLEKKSENKGYVTKISGYNVNLKQIAPLPFTGNTGEYKKLIIISSTIFVLVLIIFKFKKKIIFFLKEYKIMK